MESVRSSNIFAVFTLPGYSSHAEMFGGRTYCGYQLIGCVSQLPKLLCCVGCMFSRKRKLKCKYQVVG